MNCRLSIFLAAALTFLASCAARPEYGRYQRPNPPAQRTQAPAVRVASTPIMSNYFPGDLPHVRADSLIVIDARTGETLAQKGADVRRAVASTQKLLTALIIVGDGNLNRRVVIQPEDTRVEPSKIGFKAGDVYTREQLLHACLIKSANDAALALARDNAGSVAAFAHRMNLKARQLGAMQSSFVNPHGLTRSGQFSTARDMARVAFAASRNNYIRRIVRMPKYTFHTPRGPKHLKNTNKLLTRMGTCTGMKTGYTRASGRCLVTSASLGGRRVILVQLGSETKYIFDDAERLMIWSAGRRPPSRASYAYAGLAGADFQAR